ncbi:MAG: hypothetical protein RLZZ188_2688 [Verrucomicrobiota bacterium]|jgi:superfamily II DNA or RNA helicase
MVVVPRLELAAQTRATLARADVRAGVVAGDADPGHVDGAAPVQVATVQTMTARGLRIPATLAVFDEAHHYVSAEWHGVLDGYRKMGVPLLGLTATPCRADGVALGEAFDHLVVAASVRELMDAGHLVPCDVVAPAARQSGMADDPVDAYKRFGGDRRAIVFARDQKHAQHLETRFRVNGIPSAFIDASLSATERRGRIERFRAGELRVLVNVQILTEGFDDPSVEVVVLASGCAHAGSYLQKIGRALRPSPATGKTSALVIDLCGAVHDHGLPDDPREYSLSGRAIATGEVGLALRNCDACGGVWRAEEFRDATCPRCGAKSKGRPDPKVKRAQLDAIRATHTDEKRVENLRRLYLRADAEGKKRMWAHFIFRSRYHRFPSKAEMAAAEP